MAKQKETIKGIKKETSEKLTYYYPDSMKKANKKWLDNVKDKGMDRIQTSWVNKKTKDRILNIRSNFGSWEDFLKAVIESFRDLMSDEYQKDYINENTD